MRSAAARMACALIIGLSLLAPCWPGQRARAASLQLAPTSLSLRPDQNADGLWLSNSGTDTVQIQARIYAWTQHDGDERLEPTDALLVSPPMRALAPGERQLIRVIRRNGAPPPNETAYRVIVDELPSRDLRQGMQFVLRYSVPVFVQPAGSQPMRPSLQTRLVQGDDGKAALEVTNHGAGHAQIADLSYAQDGRTRVILAGLVGYVLTGQTMRWPLERPAREFADGTFTARINGDANESALPLASASP